MPTTTSKITSATAALALALVAALTLSGCFGNPLDDLVKDGIGGVVKEATGADLDLGGKSVPADFPGQIPLARGEIGLAAAATVEGRRVWTISMTVSETAAFGDLHSGFLAAGFEENVRSETMGIYEGHGVNVVVKLTDVKGKLDVAYVVTEKDRE